MRKFTILIIFTLFFNLTIFSQQKDLDEMTLDELLNLTISSVSKVEEKLSQSPAVVDVITADMIRAMGYRTIYDVLMHTPGFWNIVDVNDKIVGVRGVHSSVNQKFLLLINGKRVTENLWNLTDIDYNISLANVKRIEIIRGPGSAIYGRAALTAVINVVTYSGEELDGLNFNLGVGNYGYKTFGFSYGSKNERGDEIEVWGHLLRIDGQEKDVPSYQDGAKNRINGKEIIDRFEFPTGSFGARFNNDKWTLNLIYQMRQYQQPRASDGQLEWQNVNNNSYYKETFADRLLGEEHKYLIFDIERKFDVGEIKNSIVFNYTFSQIRLRENQTPFRDLTPNPSWQKADSLELSLGELFEFNIEAYRIGLEYFGQYQLSKGKSAVWGLEVYQTTPILDQFHSNFIGVVKDKKLVKELIPGGFFREKPDGLFDKLRTEYLYSAFAELRYSLIPMVGFTLGARYDYHVKGEDYKQEGVASKYPDKDADALKATIEKTTGQLSPRIALNFQPFESDLLTVKMIYNKSFIAPGYFYRYADPSTSYAGGPWLKSETLDSYIFDVESIYNTLSIKALYFLNINKDLLTRDNTLSPPRYTSLGKLATQGIEFDASYAIKNYSVFVNYSYLIGYKSQTDDVTAKTWIMDDNSIKNFPSHFGNIGLTAKFFENTLSLGLLASWNGKIKSPVGVGVDAGKVIELPAVTKFDITIGYYPKFIDNLYASLSIYNLLDKEYRLGGTVKIPYYQAGRWFLFNLNYKL